MTIPINRLKGIGFYRSPPGGALSPHRTEGNQLLFELITEGAVYVPHGDFLLGVGAVFVHQRGQETISRTEGRGHYACVTANYVISPDQPEVEWLRWFLWEDQDEFLRFTEEVLTAFHRSGRDRNVIGDYFMSQMRYRMDQYQHQACRQGVPPRLAQVLGYMESNYSQDLDTEMLAQEVGLSASHLHAEFVQHLATAPHQHLIRIRMHAARHLLATTNDPIKSIAAQVGYANTENFCRAFKKLAGVTASQYRIKFRTYGHAKV